MQPRRAARPSPVPAAAALREAPLGDPALASLPLAVLSPPPFPGSCSAPAAAGEMLVAGLALALCALQLCPPALGGSQPALLVERSGSRRLSKVRDPNPCTPLPFGQGRGREGCLGVRVALGVRRREHPERRGGRKTSPALLGFARASKRFLTCKDECKV